MKLKNLVTQSALAALLTVNAFAQTGGSVGGGNLTEGDLKYYMNRLDAYLSSDEGKQTFPEIVAYDQAHPHETFHQMIQRTRPVVQKGELRDSFGQVRDCLSYIDQHYFVCNADTLPNKTLDNQPSFYRIVFHELLVQAGIEKPINKNIPSEYPISSRINQNVHLETYQEWVPGKAKLSNLSIAVSIDGKALSPDSEMYFGIAKSIHTHGLYLVSSASKPNLTLEISAQKFILTGNRVGTQTYLMRILKNDHLIICDQLKAREFVQYYDTNFDRMRERRITSKVHSSILDMISKNLTVLQQEPWLLALQ